MTSISALSGIAERYGYSPYGRLFIFTAQFASRTDSEFNWTRNFAGYVLDGHSQLLLSRHRFYHACTGSWLQRDSHEYREHLSLYHYVRLQPLQSVDPTGMYQFSNETGLSCNSSKRNCLKTLLDGVRDILASNENGNGTGNNCFTVSTTKRKTSPRCQPCRRALGACMLATLDSNIAIQCSPLPKDDAVTRGDCIESNSTAAFLTLACSPNLGTTWR